jgi:histidine triad (HIT) family protein
VLVVPRKHYANVFDLAAADAKLLSELIELANSVAQDECDGEYRLVFNTGPLAGQSVFHVHGHVLGGKQLGWSPA